MNKELEEAKKVLTELKDNVALFSTGWKSILKQKEQQAIETVLNYIDNSISKEVIEKKIEELNDEEKEIYKKDIGNNELYRLKIIDETIKVLQELLEEK